MSLNYQEGQILLAAKRRRDEGYHLIVYLKESEKRPGHFIGLMLSSKPTDGNIKMDVSHFGNGFIYKDTHVANRILLKPEEWGPFKEIGNLTQEGLDFVNSKIPSDDDPPLWDEL